MLAELHYLKCNRGTSLTIQWLRFYTPSAEGLSLIPGQETRSGMYKQKSHIPQARQEILCAPTKPRSSQMNTFLKK